MYSTTKSTEARRRTRRPVPRPDAALSRRKLSDDDFRALPCGTASTSSVTRRCRIAIPYGFAVDEAVEEARAYRPQIRTRLRPFQHATDLQLNWPKLPGARHPRERATVQMHAIQTSGNFLPNITRIIFRGVAQDECRFLRVCEIIRQCPVPSRFCIFRDKFKFAVNGAKSDRAAVAVHESDCTPSGTRRARWFRVLSEEALAALRRSVPSSANSCPGGICVTYIEAICGLQSLRTRDNIHQARIQDPGERRGPEKFREESMPNGRT